MLGGHARLDPRLCSSLFGLGARIDQVLDQLRVRLVALLRVLLQHAIDHIGRGSTDSRGKGLQAHLLTLDMLESHHRGGLGIKGRTAGDGVKESSAQAVNITAKVLRLAIELLRGHVIRGAPDLAARFGTLFS